MSDQAMASDCEHAYVTRVRGGEPVSVRACSLCGQPDWPDLREQVEQLVAAALPGPEIVLTAIAALDALAGDAREPERYRSDFRAAAEALRGTLLPRKEPVTGPMPTCDSTIRHETAGVLRCQGVHLRQVFPTIHWSGQYGWDDSDGRIIPPRVPDGGQHASPEEPRRPLGWWTISGEALLEALRRAHEGELADVLYLELVANSDVTDYRKPQDGETT